MSPGQMEALFQIAADVKAIHGTLLGIALFLVGTWLLKLWR